MKKIIFLFLLFYILILFQTSFFVHFSVSGIIPNFILIAVIFINLFTPRRQIFGIGAAIIGGFYLDVFSLSHTGFSGFFGYYILLSLFLAFFVKFFFKKHVRVPVIKKL